jgi:hypothetical protein
VSQERTAAAAGRGGGEEGDDADGGKVLESGVERVDAAAGIAVADAVGRNLLGANDGGMRKNVKGGAGGAALILAVDRGGVLELSRRLRNGSDVASKADSDSRQARRVVFDDATECGNWAN